MELSFIAFTFIVFTAVVSAAPPTDELPECLPMKNKETEISECCKLTNFEGKGDAVKQCFALVKEKPVAAADKNGAPPKPEGYDCMEDCVISKMGFMGTDKKVDAAKMMAAVKSQFTGDWAAVGAASLKKCLESAGTNKGTCSSTGSDELMHCFFRETYMNCPEKLWTNSAVCNANKERLQKCPKALPFHKKML